MPLKFRTKSSNFDDDGTAVRALGQHMVYLNWKMPHATLLALDHFDCGIRLQREAAAASGDDLHVGALFLEAMP
jgi:hypothetical protein